MVRGQKMWESLILSAVVLHLLLLRNELGITWTRTLWCSVDLVILITAMEIFGAFVISDEDISYISGDDQQLAGKTSSYKEELHETVDELWVLFCFIFFVHDIRVDGLWFLLFFWINDIRIRHGVCF
ncbi:hypothetical protein LOK49_LG06G00273 [Camellia lanceoleosa]|uniref:Uncharacterized protein n=1 Tax=Camellia lanceoleosa TaxID=1840588 RepID=A0ACC0HDL6_9ERIC|nr:hypothetical protein LOK49_LG06G00273 [Camellia lanceoleosa]